VFLTTKKLEKNLQQSLFQLEPTEDLMVSALKRQKNNEEKFEKRH